MTSSLFFYYYSRSNVYYDEKELMNDIREDEKKVLKRIKNRVSIFEKMSIKEYERLQKEYAEYIFSIIEDFIREEDKEQIKAKVHEIIDEYSITSLNSLLLMSIALKVLSEYLRVNENQDDIRTYKLSEQLSELRRETLMFIEYAKIRRVEEECTIRAKKKIIRR